MYFVKENFEPDCEDSKKKKFRFSARNLFLIYYSQTSLTKEEIIEQLKAILMDKINEYIICQEKHDDSGFQIHVYFKLYSKVNICNSSKLDLRDSSGKVTIEDFNYPEEIKN